MIETERQEHRTIRAAFGSDAHLIESGPTIKQPGRVAIMRDGALLGDGRTFTTALADALSFEIPGVVRASDMGELLPAKPPSDRGQGRGGKSIPSDRNDLSLDKNTVTAYRKIAAHKE